jgi:hypothetical protein
MNMKRLGDTIRALKGEKGLALFEPVAVVCILLLLTAIAIPNTGKFAELSKVQAANIELHEVQTAVYAAMVYSSSPIVAYPGTLSPTSDITVAFAGGKIYTVGGYIKGGAAAIRGTYEINGQGEITTHTYP